MATATLERPTLNDHVQRVLADAPPLTAETRERIITLFRAGAAK